MTSDIYRDILIPGGSTVIANIWLASLSGSIRAWNLTVFTGVSLMTRAFTTILTNSILNVTFHKPFALRSHIPRVFGALGVG